MPAMDASTAQAETKPPFMHGERQDPIAVAILRARAEELALTPRQAWRLEREPDRVRPTSSEPGCTCGGGAAPVPPVLYEFSTRANRYA